MDTFESFSFESTLIDSLTDSMIPVGLPTTADAQDWERTLPPPLPVNFEYEDDGIYGGYCVIA